MYYSLQVVKRTWYKISLTCCCYRQDTATRQSKQQQQEFTSFNSVREGGRRAAHRRVFPLCRAFRVIDSNSWEGSSPIHSFFTLALRQAEKRGGLSKFQFSFWKQGWPQNFYSMKVCSLLHVHKDFSSSTWGYAEKEGTPVRMYCRCNNRFSVQQWFQGKKSLSHGTSAHQ